MTSPAMRGLLRYRSPALAVAVLLALVACAVVVPLVPGEKRITAYFTETPALYPGDSVRVLGVEVGKIESITPEPGQVKVVLHYDPSIRIPAEAKAAIVSPTLVSARFIQLAPVYRGGAELPDDATIPRARTVTPVEWDSTVRELTELARQLGPGAGEATGALGRALDVAHANLDGQGDQIHDTIRNASAAMTTLAAGGEDLFGTIRNLQSLVANLKENGDAVEAFSQQLAQVSSVLAENREQLAAVFTTLDRVAELIRNFVRDNRAQLGTAVDGLAKVAKQIADNRQALGDLLQRAPVGVSNFNNTYDPTGSFQAGGFALTNFSDPATFVCSLIFAAGGHNDSTNSTCEAAITPFVEVLKTNNIPLTFPVQTAPAPTGGG
jgi:phospholipid/cholesterol/gamma-HCH transport system substrate-binding protein